MKISVALILSIVLLVRDVPAVAAPDVSEARRRFVAAVHSSDKDVAGAETALEDLISKASATLASHREELEKLQRLLKALRDFKAEKGRILARDLGTHQRLMKATEDYARACHMLAAVLAITVAVVAIVVPIALTAVTAGAVLPIVAVAASAAAVAAMAAIVLAIPILLLSLSEILRALGFREGADAVGNTQSEAQRFLKDNPWFVTAVSEVALVAGALSAIASAMVSLRQADAAARDAQARLKALPKPALPAVPAALTNFDGHLSSQFSVHLDSGKATVGSADATLEGGVTISLRNDPSAKVSVNGRIVLGMSAAAAPPPSGNSMAKAKPGLVAVGPSVRTWTTLEGQGSVRVSGYGAAITIPSVTLRYSAGSILFTGGEAAVRGCTHTLAAGSAFNTSGISMEGSLKCGPWSVASSALQLEKSGLSGGGTFSAWGKSFSMKYSASGDALTAKGTLSGPDMSFTRVPGLEAEYRIESPKLDLKIEGPSLSPSFNLSKVTVRTTAKRPNGNPWSSASLTPGTIVVPAPPSNGIPVPLPNLPSPGDVEKSARDLCESGARKTLVGGALSNALALCRSSHPSPPGIPSLPSGISPKVGDVFK